MNNNDTRDDEIDLLELFGVLWQGKWLILLMALLFGSVAFVWLRITPPTFQADLLLKVDSKSGGIGAVLLGNLDNVLGSSNNASDTQIEIIKSRSVLGQTVAQFDLEKRLSRPFSWQDILEPKPAIQMSQLVFRLNLPDTFNRTENKLSLHIKDNKYVELKSNGDTILAGKQGEMLQKDGYSLLFDGGDQQYLVGEVLNIGILDNTQAINALRGHLSISSLDKSGTLLQMRLTGKDPHYAEQLLDNIANNYVQSIEKQDVEKFAQGVKFIEDQLPTLQLRLEKAEQALKDYQVNHETVNLNTEGETTIRALAQIEAELTNLKLKENELRSRYTNNHPALQSILRQYETLQTRKLEIEKRLSLVPEAAQGLIKLKRDVEVNQAIYLQLLGKLQELKIVEASTVGSVQVVDNARAGGTVKPKKRLIMAVAILAGIVLSSLLLLVRYLMHNRILTIEDVTDNTGLNVIATVPESKKQRNHEKQLRNNHRMDENSILSIVDPQDLSVEALRGLRTNLHFSLQNKNNKVLLVSGPTENVGKSFVSTNLAALLAQAGQKTVLINADLRKGYLDLQFKVDNVQKSLSEYLQQADLDMKSCIHQTQIENLSFIPCGNKPKNPAELLSNPKLVSLITFLREYYDIVIIDTPPILPVSDAQYLAQYADIVLLVIRFDLTSIRELILTTQKNSINNLNICGVVINGVRKVKNGKYYNYHYSYK